MSAAVAVPVVAALAGSHSPGGHHGQHQRRRQNTQQTLFHLHRILSSCDIVISAVSGFISDTTDRGETIHRRKKNFYFLQSLPASVYHSFSGRGTRRPGTRPRRPFSREAETIFPAGPFHPGRGAKHNEKRRIIMTHTAELIAVGTELLLGNIANTDAQILSQGLSTLGITVHYHTVVGDNPQRLRQALDIARTRADIIITTGGLGPTYDDLTKQTICAAFGRELELHPDILEGIRSFFAKTGRTMPENNVQQAMLPVGCTVFDNPVGTAPGCAFEEGGVHVLMLPGPPFECRYMFENRAAPYLRALTDGVIVSHEIRVYGMGESHVEEKLRDIMTTMTNPTLAPYAKPGECMLRATAKAPTAQQAEEMLTPLVGQVEEILGDVVYGVDVGSLEEVASRLLREKGLTLSAAESCTGGLIAKRITDLPGASQIFRGGVVSYTNDVKADVLGVPREVLEEYGAVSEPVARAMAQGCRKLCGSDIALSVTGLAGPEGDDRGNEVGTVYIALSDSQGTICKKFSCGMGRGRDRVRSSAAQNAFDMLRRRLLVLPL